MDQSLHNRSINGITMPNLKDGRRGNYLFQLISVDYLEGYVLTEKRPMNLGITRDAEEITKIK